MTFDSSHYPTMRRTVEGCAFAVRQSPYRGCRTFDATTEAMTDNLRCSGRCAEKRRAAADLHSLGNLGAPHAGHPLR